MTKKDFELIARIIRESGLDVNDTERIANDFAYTLASKNPRFDKDKFLKACGVEVENERIKTCVNCWAITKTSLESWHCANCGVDN